MVIPNKWMITLLLLALVARIGAALAIGGSFHFADEAVYVDTARRLSEGAGFGVEYPRVPGYPVFLTLLSLGLPTSLTFLRVGQAAVAALGTVFVFRLADRMFGYRTAIAAGVVYALDPLLVISSGLLYPEAVAALLLPPVVLTALDASERDALARSAITGVLLGILALLRPVALVLPPVVASWVAVTVTARPRRRVAHIAALGLGFLLVLAPWTARNLGIHGQLVPVATAGNRMAPAPDEVGRRGLFVSLAYRAWSDPDDFVFRLTRRFVQFWELKPTRLMTDDPVKREELHRLDPRLEVQPLFARSLRDRVSVVSFALELSLALVGLVAVARTRWRQTLLAVAVIIAYGAGYALVVAKLRYRIPILPLLFLFTGVGAAAVFSVVRRPRAGAGSSPPAPQS